MGAPRRNPSYDSAMETIDVCVVAYNRPEYTANCLEALYQVPHGARIRPIVVDNGSRNRTRALLASWVESHAALPEGRRAEVERPTLIPLGENKGFAGGVNEALKASQKGRPFCVLHNDAIPFPGCFGEMQWVLANGDEDVSVVIPRTNYANEGTPCVEELRRRFEPLKPGTKDRLGMEDVRAVVGKCHQSGATEIIGPDGLLQKTYPRCSYSPEIASFCMLVRSGLFDEYGPLDTDFFPRGYEDKYWFQPVERSGGICMLANWSYCFHFGNMSSDGPGFDFSKTMEINREMFEKKVVERDKALFARSKCQKLS